MSKALEEMRAEAAHNSRVENATTMIRDGLDYQTIAKYSGLSLEEVKELASRKIA